METSCSNVSEKKLLNFTDSISLISAISNKQRRHLFRQLIKNLKDSLNLVRKTRKFEYDSFLKRIKARFFRCIHKCIKSCFLYYNIKLKTLPQKFITDIRIPTNKKILKMTLEEIYSMNNINLRDLFSENEPYKIYPEKIQTINEIMKLRFSKAYNLYLESFQYQRDLIMIKTTEDEVFFKLFIFASENFISYYRIKKGHIMRKKLRNNPNVIFFTTECDD